MIKRSTTTNLDNQRQVDVIYTDFQKAFDQIDHFVLLHRLNSLGYSEPLCNIFESYLLNRKQFVRFNGFESTTFTPTSGVPQDLNLLPLLFNIFIHDRCKLIKSEKLLCADDLKITNRNWYHT